eukprot:11587832-Alexandrium_andersonii.AAC.1
MGGCVDRSIGPEQIGVCTARALASLSALPAMVRLGVELAWPLEWHALLLVGSFLAGVVVGRLGSARA